MQDEVKTRDRCPRCGGKLLEWSGLSDEEREVALRLPGSAAHPGPERRARHRWCTRCWFEETHRDPQTT